MLYTVFLFSFEKNVYLDSELELTYNTNDIFYSELLITRIEEARRLPKKRN